MVIVRRVLVFASVVALAGTTPLVAQRGGNAPRGGAAPKISDAQRKAIQSILTVADDAAAGKAMPNDLGLTWLHDDLMKVTQQGQAFVPFVISLDPAKVTPGPLSVYWRVVDKNAPPPPPADAKKDDKKAPAAPTFAYESLTTATAVAGEPTIISRSFSTHAGSYDVYVVVKEGNSAMGDNKDKKDDKNAPPQKVAVIKQPMEVPDLWNGELSTSSVIVAEKIERLTAPLSNEQKISHPYALGAIEIVPYTRTKFTKKDELAVFILVYNSKMDSANKPDVKVEFNFFTKQGGGEKLFNSTLPTNLNGQTLTPQDIASGQLQAGQSVPLASFPEGDYRMEVKVTDNVAKKTVSRDVNFTVSGS
ncbi:MAG TPA: hypothetical protein VJP86_11555 [Vicinamibacterales bacterium]|jgi:hypothetical protein|nr:hypothetical protein [Vicinamibacterales bacterium]